jgi:translocation and assembly module TamB
MADAAVIERSGSEPPKIRLRPDWRWRLLNELFALFIALLFLLAALLVLLDSAPGHRFIVDQLGRFSTASGLRIHIGRIDGSIFGKSELRNVAVADQRGVFLTSPDIKLDWTPGAWLYHKLSINEVTAERVNLIRLPALKPSTRKGPILPGFDIHIGELPEAESCGGRPTFIRDGRWSSCRRWWPMAAIISPSTSMPNRTATSSTSAPG